MKRILPTAISDPTPGTGPFRIMVLVVLVGLVMWILWVYTFVDFDFASMRRIWLYHSNHFPSVFALSIFVTVLFGYLILVEVSTRLLSGHSIRAGDAIAYAASFLIVLVLGHDLYAMGSVALNDSWYQWAQIDEPADVKSVLLARVLGPSDHQCSARRGRSYLVELANGKSISVILPHGSNPARGDIITIREMKKRFSSVRSYRFSAPVKVADTELFWRTNPQRRRTELTTWDQCRE